MVEILKTKRRINTLKYTNPGEAVTRAEVTVPLQLCQLMTYFRSREKAWLPESGMAQPRRVRQTPLGRADCHREYLACSFFKKYWVSILNLSLLDGICVLVTTLGLRWLQGYLSCQQLLGDSSFLGLAGPRIGHDWWPQPPDELRPLHWTAPVPPSQCLQPLRQLSRVMDHLLSLNLRLDPSV